MSLSTDYSSTINKLDLTQINLPNLDADAHAVLEFWFDKDHEPYWFIADDKFDQKIADKFGAIWQAAKQGECAHWRRSEANATLNAYSDHSTTNLAGRLAEIIVLDQFSRNLYRQQASAFAKDDMALVLAQEAIYQAGFDSLPWQWRQFMIMPMMHSESAIIHTLYLPLFEQLENAETLDFEYRHQAIIEKFGRYPHRNAALNRESTDAEIAFLQQPNSSF